METELLLKNLRYIALLKEMDVHKKMEQLKDSTGSALTRILNHDRMLNLQVKRAECQYFRELVESCMQYGYDEEGITYLSKEISKI